MDRGIFDKLCAALQLPPAAQAELLAAYLRDQSLGHGELVEISIRGSTRSKPAPRHLPRELEEAFDLLEEESIVKPRLRHALVDLAAYIAAERRVNHRRKS